MSQYNQPYGGGPGGYGGGPGGYGGAPMMQQPVRSGLLFDRVWSSGLCDCCSDCGSCCLAYWFWPCFLCCLDSAAKECPLTTCCIHSFSYSAPIAMLRAKIRGAYKINGSICGDCCCAFWCPCCVALQMYRELKSQGEA